MNVYVQTAAGFFLGLTTAFLVTLLVLSILPTHDDARHTAIKATLTPFMSADLSFLSTEEASHLRDVARLVWYVLAIFIISLWATNRYGVHRYSGYGLLLIIAFCAGIALKGFGKLWEKFHHVFFPQGNWQFANESVLIQLYPESYFFAAALIFTALIICIAAFFIQDAWRNRVFQKQSLKKVRLL